MRYSAIKNIEAIRLDEQNRVDREAEAVRKLYITPGEGQAMTYQQKYEEAVDYLTRDENEPFPEYQVPHLVAELGTTGATLEEVATVIVGTKTSWRSVSAVIEGKRRRTNVAIASAATPAEAKFLADNWDN